MQIINRLCSNKPVVQHWLFLFNTSWLNVQIWLTHCRLESLHRILLFHFQSILFISKFLNLFIKCLLRASSPLPIFFFFHQFCFNLIVLFFQIIKYIILILTNQGSWLGFLNSSCITLTMHIVISFVFILFNRHKVCVHLLTLIYNNAITIRHFPLFLPSPFQWILVL